MTLLEKIEKTVKDSNNNYMEKYPMYLLGKKLGEIIRNLDFEKINFGYINSNRYSRISFGIPQQNGILDEFVDIINKSDISDEYEVPFTKIIEDYDSELVIRQRVDENANLNHIFFKCGFMKGYGEDGDKFDYYIIDEQHALFDFKVEWTIMTDPNDILEIRIFNGVLFEFKLK